jgi:hypothetical protein
MIMTFLDFVIINDAINEIDFEELLIKNNRILNTFDVNIHN